MIVLGITGGVGSGKSEVLSYLNQTYGAVICQADQVAMQLERAGTPCFGQIVDYFGDRIIGADGELDRKELAQIVFADEKKLKALNQIVHPCVKREIASQLDAAKKKQKTFFVVEAALLLEEKYNDFCDEVWYIYTSLSERKHRLVASRGYSEEKIQAIMNQQKSEAQFKEACDFVIDNSGPFSETKKQIDLRLGAKWNEIM